MCTYRAFVFVVCFGTVSTSTSTVEPPTTGEPANTTEQPVPKFLEPFQLKEGPTAHKLKSGPIEVIDLKTIRISDLYYDGTGPDAFWIFGPNTGKQTIPPEFPEDHPGYKLPDELGSCKVLELYNNVTIDLILPSVLTVNQISWLAIYCFAYKHTFGWVDFEAPRRSGAFQNVSDALTTLVAPDTCGNPVPIKLSSFQLRIDEGQVLHNLTSESNEIVNIKSFRLNKLYYDGTASDAHWMVGTGQPPLAKLENTPGVQIPDETGSCKKVREMSGETILLVLPGDLTVDSIDWLALYCLSCKETFGWIDFKTSRGGPTFGYLLPVHVTPPNPCESRSRGETLTKFTTGASMSLLSALFLNWVVRIFG